MAKQPSAGRRVAPARPWVIPALTGREETISATSTQTAAADAGFEAAHAALKADRAVQFNLPPAKPPPEPPQWLRDFFEWLREFLEPVGRFLAWLSSFMPEAPYARILLWTMIALAVAGLAWMLWIRFREGKWRLPLARGAVPAELADEEEWSPEHAPALSWLEEADRLARQGQFTEAVHHLLIRSIEDIARRRPQLDRPALTSREIAAAEVIPDRARGLFAGIARLVERSWFGGRSVGADDWAEARAAYADFALPKNWSAVRA